MKWLLLACVMVACILLALPGHMTWMRASNGKMYNVKRHREAHLVVERLAMLELRIKKFVDEASKTFAGDPRLRRIQEQWDGTIGEVPSDDEVAYSLSKDSIALCVRNKDGVLESVNGCMFVLIHELAHIATPEYGHTPLFWENMKVLLEMAERLNYYSDTDKTSSETFCGHPLGVSPIKCVRMGTCQSSLASLSSPSSSSSSPSSSSSGT